MKDEEEIKKNCTFFLSRDLHAVEKMNELWVCMRGQEKKKRNEEKKILGSHNMMRRDD